MKVLILLPLLLLSSCAALTTDCTGLDQERCNWVIQQRINERRTRPVYYPAYEAPVSTHCTTFGTQTQCTTW